MNSRPVFIAIAAMSSVCVAFPVLGLGTGRNHLDQCITLAARSLPRYISTTLERIDGTDRRLLALRSYLRNRETLSLRWSWSDEEIARYMGSAEYRTVQRELAKVVARFEELNPGYTLYVNTEVRSLETQIRRWNENDSVGAAARELAKAMKRQLPRRGCEKAGGEPFIQYLSNWLPRPRAPTLAAPGLSKHGQARAFDFQVKRGEKIVAGTESARSVSAWDRKGWTKKLREAVSASGKFTGPLRIPYEPWHYEYGP